MSCKGLLLLRYFSVREEKHLRILTPDGVLRLRALAAAGKSPKFGLSLEPPVLLDFRSAGTRLIDYEVIKDYESIKKYPFSYFLFWVCAVFTVQIFPEGSGEAPFDEFIDFLDAMEALSGGGTSDGESRDIGDSIFRERLSLAYSFLVEILERGGWLSERSVEALRKMKPHRDAFVNLIKTSAAKLGLKFPVQKIDELFDTFSRWE